MTVAEAVRDAVEKTVEIPNKEVVETKETVGNETQQTEDTEVVPVPEKPKVEEPKVEEKAYWEELGLTEVEMRKGAKLLSMLKDENTRGPMITQLAKEAGILSKESGETPKQVTKSLLEELKETTPEEFHYILEGIVKPLEALVNKQVDEKTKGIKTDLESQRVKEAENLIDSEIELFFSKNEGARSLDAQIAKQMQKMPMTPSYNGDMQEYLDDIYSIVGKSKQESETVKKVVKRIDDNIKDTKNEPSEANSVKRGSRLPTLQESIKAAMRGENFT